MQGQVLPHETVARHFSSIERMMRNVFEKAGRNGRHGHGHTDLRLVVDVMSRISDARDAAIEFSSIEFFSTEALLAELKRRAVPLPSEYTEKPLPAAAPANIPPVEEARAAAPPIVAKPASAVQAPVSAQRPVDSNSADSAAEEKVVRDDLLLALRRRVQAQLHGGKIDKGGLIASKDVLRKYEAICAGNIADGLMLARKRNLGIEPSVASTISQTEHDHRLAIAGIASLLVVNSANLSHYQKAYNRACFQISNAMRGAPGTTIR